MADTAVGIAFQGKDQVSPVVRGIRSTMDQFKRDAATGFGLGAGISVFNLATRALGGVVDIMGDAVKAAMEEEAGIALLTRSIEENSASWDGNIDRIEEVISAREELAFADDEQRDSLRQLVAVTKDHEKALDLQRIAMDLARLRGMSLADAGALIGKVYSGNTAILSRYFGQIFKGMSSTEALAEIQRRATGQAEAYAETTQGKLVRAQIALENAMESLGFALTPVVGQLAEIASDLIPQMVEGVGDFVEEVRRFDPAFDRVVRVNDAIDEIAETMNLTSKQTDTLRAKWTALARESDLVTGTQEELTVAILDQEEAWLLAEHAAMAARFMFSRGAKAAAGAGEEYEEMARALELVAGGLEGVRQEGKETERMWRRMAGGADRNKKRIRELREEIETWARRFRRALRQNDTEAAAFAQSQGARAEQELADRNAVKQAMNAERAALLGIGNAADSLDGKTATVTVDVIGKANVEAALRTISNLVAMSGNVVSVGLQTLGFGRRASGGPVASGRSYLVGERGPEILTMGGRDGHITPNHATGGGNVYLDGHWVGRLMDERMGRRYGMTAAPGSYRS